MFPHVQFFCVWLYVFSRVWDSDRFNPLLNFLQRRRRRFISHKVQSVNTDVGNKLNCFWEDLWILLPTADLRHTLALSIWESKKQRCWVPLSYFSGSHPEACCRTAGRWKLWWSTWRPRVDWRGAWKGEAVMNCVWLYWRKVMHSTGLCPTKYICM